jgi:hypothetical protein
LLLAVDQRREQLGGPGRRHEFALVDLVQDAAPGVLVDVLTDKQAVLVIGRRSGWRTSNPVIARPISGRGRAGRVVPGGDHRRGLAPSGIVRFAPL